MKIKILSILLLLLFTGFSYPQFNGKRFNLAVNGVYTTSAKIYLNPNSSDVLLRNNSFPLENIFNFEVDLRYHVIKEILLGINTEYMTKSATGRNLTVFSGNRTVTIPVEDGFRMIPAELTVYYLLPFSSENFRFLMGGGVGFYFGEHTRTFGDAKVENAGRKIGYGLHVLISTDFMVRDNIALRAEMKFRDPQFRVTSRYNKTEVQYEGGTIRLGSESFESKINIEGVTFIGGVAFYF